MKNKIFEVCKILNEKYKYNFKVKFNEETNHYISGFVNNHYIRITVSHDHINITINDLDKGKVKSIAEILKRSN